MNSSCKIIEQIMNLHILLEIELRRISPNPNPFSVIMDYAKTLPSDKQEMLSKIHCFRNQWAHATPTHPAPKLPENYKEWIAFLENEIALLKNN